MLTIQQLKERSRFIGASEVAAILGLDKYRSAWDVWALKTGKIEQTEHEYYTGDTLAAKVGSIDVLEMGRLLEGSALDMAERIVGKLLRDPAQLEFPSPSGLPLLSHPDALVEIDGRPVEAKTVGIMGPIYQEWGDSGTNDVPENYFVQGQAHMHCTMSKTCIYPVIFGGRPPGMYEVEFAPNFWDMVADRLSAFWRINVHGNIQPDCTPGIEFIKQIRREPNKCVNVPLDLYAEYDAMKFMASHFEELAGHAKARLLASLGDAEQGVCDFGVVTYLEQSRKGYMVQPSTFRMMRCKKNPETVELLEKVKNGIISSSWKQGKFAELTGSNGHEDAAAKTPNEGKTA